VGGKVEGGDVISHESLRNSLCMMQTFFSQYSVFRVRCAT
jgi:hypothetical protein